MSDDLDDWLDDHPEVRAELECLIAEERHSVEVAEGPFWEAMKSLLANAPDLNWNYPADGQSGQAGR